MHARRKEQTGGQETRCHRLVPIWYTGNTGTRGPGGSTGLPLVYTPFQYIADIPYQWDVLLNKSTKHKPRVVFLLLFQSK